MELTRNRVLEWILQLDASNLTIRLRASEEQPGSVMTRNLSHLAARVALPSFAALWKEGKRV